MSEDTLLAFNGIDGDDGDYLLPKLTLDQVAAVALHRDLPPALLDTIKGRYAQSQTQAVDTRASDPDAALRSELQAHRHQSQDSFRVHANTTDLAQTGWGVVFAKDIDPAVVQALDPLLEHRRKQVESPPRVSPIDADEKPPTGRYYAYLGSAGYRPGETKNAFLTRHGVGPGAPNPSQVPYYLLLVGDPNEIPYRFQYQLDVQYAVGRIHFETPEEYAQYAANVIAAETSAVRRPKRAAFFGVANRDDQATELSSQHLITPLADTLAEALPSWQIDRVIGEHATRARLNRLLGGDETPALLFAAGHGMGFRNGSPRQMAHQGALLCQDWPGPLAHKGSIPEDFYFSADTLGSDAKLLGTIVFLFACYGAGTPDFDEFSRGAGQRLQIAEKPFVASLPRALLRSGALAVVGHVERAWGYSFYWDRAGSQIQPYKNMLSYLMRGQPIGAAVDWLNERYAELASDLANELDEIEENGYRPNPLKLATLWTANNDARNYVIIGDPAVRLLVS